MRLSNLVPLALITSAFASAVVRPALSGGSRTARAGQTKQCIKNCTTTENAINECGTDQACSCTTALAQALQACAQCQVAADPTQEQDLQTGLDQYTSGCDQSDHSVGSLTVTLPGSATSTSSVASASGSASATPTLTSATSSGSPAFASSTPVSSSSASSVPAATATATTTASSGNGAASMTIQTTGALLAAGVAMAYAIM
ncbi:hypothetical protein FRB90_010218 [Tulasnella sp. 427]|nr:hypothetical protein FRB90_010218 [Tulasnella sp. 427]